MEEIDIPIAANHIPTAPKTRDLTHMASGKKITKKKAKVSFGDLKPRKNPKGGQVVTGVTIDFSRVKLS